MSARPDTEELTAWDKLDLEFLSIVAEFLAYPQYQWLSPSTLQNETRPG